jgi:aminoglycoside phosphotransferase (APT) family kinase protein
MTTPELRQRLEGFLIRQTGKDATIDNAAPLAGGASRDMWLVEVTIGGSHHKLVLRRDPPTTMNEQALTRAQEFAVMERAHEKGVKVSRPRWLCDDPSVLGGAFFLMDYVEGIAIGRKIVQAPELADARKALPEQMAEQLALIHSLEPFDFLPRPPEGVNPAQDAIHQCYAVLDSLGVSSPVFEFALRWADRHAPPCEQMTFIHGDFRLGNLIVNQNGLAAVADWEFSHVGDPMEELGYPCMRDWRFGVGKLRFGGIDEREPFLHAYEQHSGRKVDREAVDFWEFLGNVRWGVICLAQANRHLSGHEPSVELASLGRRSAEMQMEMLRLMQQIGI